MTVEKLFHFLIGEVLNGAQFAWQLSTDKGGVKHTRSMTMSEAFSSKFYRLIKAPIIWTSSCLLC